MARGKRFAEPDNSNRNSFFGNKNRDDVYETDTDELFIKSGYDANTIETSNEFNQNFAYDEQKNEKLRKEQINIDEFAPDYNQDDEDFGEEELRKERITKTIAILVTVVVVIAAIYVVFNYVNSNKEPAVVDKKNEVSEVEVKSMISTLDGYDVLGKLVIDKIGVDQYILDSTEDKALEKGVGKLYGNEMNSIGNFSIVGHNYDTILSKLTQIIVGDEIVLVDKNENETKYKVTKNYYTEPDNLECLLQPADKTELTVITCVNGSTQRLVVKAEKVDESQVDASTSTDVQNTVDSNEENV